MMNATVEKLVKAVEGRVAPKGYVVSFAETKKNNVGDKSGIQIRKKRQHDWSNSVHRRIYC